MLFIVHTKNYCVLGLFGVYYDSQLDGIFFLLLIFSLQTVIMHLLNIQPKMLISMPGTTEWIIILVVVLLLFGGKKLPELFRGLGKGVHEFKKAKEEGENEPVDTKEKVS